MRISLLAALLLICVSSARAEWTLYRAPDSNFQASFPATPEVSVQTIEAGAGAIPYTSHLAELQEGRIAYGVVCIDYPDEVRKADPQKILDGGRDGARNKLSGRLVSETRMLHRGHPAREFTIVSDLGDEPLFYHTRLLLIGNRLYQLQVFRSGDAPVDIADVVKFFASFEQLEPTPPPEA